MCSDIAIKVSNVSKHYQIYEKPIDRLKQSLFRGKRQYYTEFKALDNVSFEVKKGETVGIIGRNGSGKSTLLQMICGTLTPTSGDITLNGRVAALLELGAGFNPEFTGRENVYMNAAILGMQADSVDDLLPNILAFSEIGDFIHQPVKTYSSGMFVRLAFSVAIMLEPDILIIDEALAVGDIYFQRKCHNKLKEFQKSGGTLLLVTHSTDSLVNLCHRGIVLNNGRQLFDGDTKDAVAVYMRTVFGSNDAKDSVAKKEKSNVDAKVTYDEVVTSMKSNLDDLLKSFSGYNHDEVRLGEGGAAVADCVNLSDIGQPLMIEAGSNINLLVKYVFHAAQENVIFGVMVRDIKGAELYACNTFQGKNKLYSFDENEILISHLALVCPLAPGRYFITIGISRFDDNGQQITAIDRRVDVLVLTVLSTGVECGGFVDMQFSFDADPLFEDKEF
ncbi:MAG: ABC transporter ATP-binding protein [Methylococcales bacterium]